MCAQCMYGFIRMLLIIHSRWVDKSKAREMMAVILLFSAKVKLHLQDI